MKEFFFEKAEFGKKSAEDKKGMLSSFACFCCHLLTSFKIYLFKKFFQENLQSQTLGAQWLSGRVLDSRPKGSGFEPHRRHCVVVLEQDTFILA